MRTEHDSVFNKPLHHHGTTCSSASTHLYHLNHSVTIGIVGCPGSGKTTTALAVCAAINTASAGTPAVVLPMDGFHYTRAQLDAMPDPAHAHARRGAPFTFDANAFVACVQHVASLCGMCCQVASPGHHHCTDQPIPVPSFDHAAGDPVDGDIVIEPRHSIVLVEGNYLLLGMINIC